MEYYLNRHPITYRQYIPGQCLNSMLDTPRFIRHCGQRSDVAVSSRSIPASCLPRHMYIHADRARNVGIVEYIRDSLHDSQA